MIFTAFIVQSTADTPAEIDGQFYHFIRTACDFSEPFPGRCVITHRFFAVGSCVTNSATNTAKLSRPTKLLLVTFYRIQLIILVKSDMLVRWHEHIQQGKMVIHLVYLTLNETFFYSVNELLESKCPLCMMSDI